MKLILSCESNQSSPLELGKIVNLKPSIRVDITHFKNKLKHAPMHLDIEDTHQTSDLLVEIALGDHDEGGLTIEDSGEKFEEG